MQVADHLKGEPALATQHLVDAVGLPDRRHQVFHSQATLLHAKADRLDGVRGLDGKVLRFVGFDKRGQNVVTKPQLLAIGDRLEAEIAERRAADAAYR